MASRNAKGIYSNHHRNAIQVIVCCLKTGECTVNDKVRASRKGTGIARQIYANCLQFLWLTHSSQRRHLIPFLNQRNERGGIQRQFCANIARADAVYTHATFRPFDCQRFRKLDDCCLGSVIGTLRLRNIDNVRRRYAPTYIFRRRYP